MQFFSSTLNGSGIVRAQQTPVGTATAVMFGQDGT
jgi:hypothetical protein